MNAQVKSGQQGTTLPTTAVGEPELGRRVGSWLLLPACRVAVTASLGPPDRDTDSHCLIGGWSEMCIKPSARCLAPVSAQ